MLAGPGGTAAYAAAASILAAEGGGTGLLLGLACYTILCMLQLAWEVLAAYSLLRRRLPIVPWRPNLMFKVYTKSRRNLLDRVTGRMVGGVVRTRGCYWIGYVDRTGCAQDRTGCSQLVFCTIRPAKVEPLPGGGDWPGGPYRGGIDWCFDCNIW
jgi:hypothetical protein